MIPVAPTPQGPCWSLWHLWSPWRRTSEGPISVADPVTVAIGEHSGTRHREIGWWYRQERTCERCGWLQIKDRKT